MKKNFLFKGVAVLGAILLLTNVALPIQTAFAGDSTSSDVNSNGGGGGGGGGSTKPATVNCRNVTTIDDFSACIAQGGEITIGDDINFGTNARFEISSPVTINGGDHTFTDEITDSWSYSLLQFKPGSEGSKIENLNFEITTENKVYDAAAIYFAAGFGNDTKKTEINEISVTGKGDGNRVIGIDSSTTSSQIKGIKITSSNFKNLMYGMYFNELVDDIEISGNEIIGTNYNAINFAATPSNIKISNNTFTNISNLKNNTYGNQYSAGIYLGNGAKNIEIEGNTIIMVYGDRHSIFIEGDNLLSISSGTFSDDVSDYTADGKCSIKNDDGNYEVKVCPTPSETFVTSKGTELPIVYDENKTIKLAETQALFKKKPIPSDPQDAAILNAIKTAEELAGTEIVEIESEDVLFFDVSAAIPTVKQTKAFRKSGSTLFSEDAFKNGSTDTGSITYDINKAVNPTWVTPNIEKVTSYNTVSKDTKVIGYTLNMDDEGDGWFYAPRMYKITFDTNGSTEEYEAQKVALTEGKATNPGIPTKEGSGFKFWSLSNEESATEYDFSAEVTGDITLYAIYGDDAFTITWKNGNDIINTGAFASGAMPAYVGDTPSKDADSTCNTYEFKEWNPSVTAVTGETTYTATFTCTSPKSSKSSGGSGGGGSSKTSTTNDTKVETGSQNNIKNDDIIKTNEDGNGADNDGDVGSQNAGEEKYNQEFRNAYDFAFKNGITTMPSIAEADMNGTLTRIAMAKMLSQYAINVLGKTPDTGKNISFPDVSPELDAQYNSGVTLAYQLGIMGINIDEFRPFDEVTRAEFVTALSRMLFGLTDGENLYYETHMQKLLEEKIITVADPDMKELRGYVMIMLMRSADK